jgi:hypothetical protein
MIIGFAGRLGSGKTELAKICETYGYQKIYFALPLKHLICNLLDIDNVDELNKLKNVEKDYSFSDVDYRMISNKTKIPFDIVKEEMNPLRLKTVREIMQFIGTDLIRTYNKDWHINKIKELMSIYPESDYVFDDVRFPNEKRAVEEMGGKVWFIMRPKTDNISNHASETALLWRDCMNNVIINNMNLKTLILRWTNFIDNYTVNSITRDDLIRKLQTEHLTDNELETIQKSLDKYFIFPETFTENEKTWDDIEKIESLDGGFKVIFEDGHEEIVTKPTWVEDLKLIYSK